MEKFFASVVLSPSRKISFLVFLLILKSSFSFKASYGCNKPFQYHDNTYQQVFIDTMVDESLGPVVREFIVQFPPGYDNTVALPLVFDVHGYSGSAYWQRNDTAWGKLAEEENFLVVWPNGMGDGPSGKNSWNCSATYGPMGITCDPNITVAECYDSCTKCDPGLCDWSSCYDDIAFFQFMMRKLKDSFCIDEQHMHYSGISNGGMFAYYLAAYTEDALGLATLNPVAASSLIGFGKPPAFETVNFSIIDFHGLLDTTIPYNESHATGTGPDDSVISDDGYFYDKKDRLLGWWRETMTCSGEEKYPTIYDGDLGFQCLKNACNNLKSIVHCFGEWGHDYPIPGNYEISARVAFEFMMDHPRKVE